MYIRGFLGGGDNFDIDIRPRTRCHLPMRHTKLIIIAILSLLAGCAQGGQELPAVQSPAQHVLIVVMDGLRRDSITAEQMPTLYGLAQQGVFFNAHHPVYPSSTQVNGTALATGMKPATSNVVANREYRPELELLHPIDMNDEYYAWLSDQERNTPFVHAPTLPELAHENNMTTIVAGTKAVAMLWDRSYRNRTTTQPTLFEGMAIPSATLDPIIADQGPFPSSVDQKYVVNTRRDIWTTRALTNTLWADRVPNLTVLWLYEPDFTQHGTGVGSKNAKLAYKSSDDRLKSVLQTLEQKGVRDSTDIIVVSDHGFSTVSRKVDVGDELRKKGGFKAETEWHKPLEKGNIIVDGLGGSIALYIKDRDEPTRQKLIAFLQNSSWAGVIFTRDGSDGTFKLADVNIDSADAPDVVVAMRWKDEVSEHGTKGTIISDGMEKGQGMHVSLSRYDMANTLVAAGPHFRKGFVDDLPSGNSDVAPTLAYIMGIKPAKTMDGRVLSEALIDSSPPSERPETKVLRSQRKLIDEKTKAEKTWSQYLKVTKLLGRAYFDEGNAGPPPGP
jgi:predicted AlkP superfamily pyrophosphatase or phosphodiesterase